MVRHLTDAFSGLPAVEVQLFCLCMKPLGARGHRRSQLTSQWVVSEFRVVNGHELARLKGAHPFPWGWAAIDFLLSGFRFLAERRRMFAGLKPRLPKPGVWVVRHGRCSQSYVGFA